MDLFGLRGMMRSVLFILVLMVGLADGTVVLIGKNVSLSFDDIEANFAPAIKESGECGVLYVAEPLDACTPLKNKADEGLGSAFALIIRGGCTFDDKVRNAQEAGFKAAIVYNNEHGPLVAMAGTRDRIDIHAVFVSKDSGETLKKYAGRVDIELWIIPTFENSAWSIMAISFITLLAVSAVLATCFFVRRHRIRRTQPRQNIREFHGMSSRLVKAMPSLRFTSVLEDNSTSATCAICLEDYQFGEKLRILPCFHKFHAVCVDSWLTTWRTFCPVCKRDASKSTDNAPPSEYTPLLSSAATTPNSSFHSSIATSSALQIPPAVQINPILPQSPFTNRHHSLASSIARVPSPQRPDTRSPPISISRSSIDLQNAASYHRSRAPPSLGLPQSSPINSRLMPSYAPSVSRSCIDVRNASYNRSHASPSLGLPQSSPINSRLMSSYAPSVSRSFIDVRNASYNRSHASPSLGLPQSSPINSRLISYVPSPNNASASNIVGSSSRLSYLHHYAESGASLSAMDSAQSLPEC